jgi:hypothetical protein
MNVLTVDMIAVLSDLRLLHTLMQTDGASRAKHSIMEHKSMPCADKSIAINCMPISSASGLAWPWANIAGRTV